MKIVLRLFFLTLFIQTSRYLPAQEMDDLDSAYLEVSDEQLFNYLNDSIQNQISFGCFAGGESSYNLELFLILARRNRFDLIDSLRNSEVNATKFIATIFVVLQEERNLVQLTIGDKKTIARLKRSMKRIDVCIGCDGYMKSNFSTLFDKDSDVGNETKTWADKLISTYYK